MVKSRATEAYLAGNKAAAKKLSLIANELNTSVAKLHTKAASNLFESRNNSTVPGTIDLHGLHPHECISQLEASLKKMLDAGYRGRCLVVTGTGNHSKSKGRIHAPVWEYLLSRGFRIRDATMEDGKGGVISFVI